MMAAAEGGCESIVACEEFRPMAECASKIMQLNGFKDDIKLVRYKHLSCCLYTKSIDLEFTLFKKKY